jgi:hypothetical protein
LVEPLLLLAVVDVAPPPAPLAELDELEGPVVALDELVVVAALELPDVLVPSPPAPLLVPAPPPPLQPKARAPESAKAK